MPKSILFFIALLSCTKRPILAVEQGVQVDLLHRNEDPERWYVPVEKDGKVGLFFVDTGYSHSACSKAWVEKEGFEKKGKAKVVGELGEVTTEWASLPPMAFGPHRFPGVKCVVRDFTETSSIRGDDNLWGVFGMDVLRNFSVEIAPHQGTLNLGPPLDLQDAHLLSHEKNQRYFVEVEAGGAVEKLLLDTGSNRSSFSKSFKGKLGKSVRVPIQVVATGGTRKEYRTLFRVEALKVGSSELKNQVVSKRKGSYGILGTDVLSQLHQKYDFKGKKVWFRQTFQTPNTLEFSQWLVSDGNTPIVFESSAH